MTSRWRARPRSPRSPPRRERRRSAPPGSPSCSGRPACGTRVRGGRPLVCAAGVGEEGAGELRGVKYLLNGGRGAPVAFIALDGAGMERIVHRALGSRRYHVTFRGPGGHSWAAFGVANPANAVGRATALLADLPTPHAPRTTCAVVRLGGGTGLNSIPQDAWLDLDLRSEDPKALAALDGTVRATLERALGDENRSEEHTSELQSPCNLVCRLLLEKKKNKTTDASKT